MRCLRLIGKGCRCRIGMGCFRLPSRPFSTWEPRPCICIGRNSSKRKGSSCSIAPLTALMRLLPLQTKPSQKNRVPKEYPSPPRGPPCLHRHLGESLIPTVAKSPSTLACPCVLPSRSSRRLLICMRTALLPAALVHPAGSFQLSKNCKARARDDMK